MRLHELFFEDRAVDFDVPDDDLPKFDDPLKAKLLGDFEGRPVYGERFNPLLDAYGIFDGEELASVVFLAAKEELVIGRRVNRVKKIWTAQDKRGAGYASCLLMFLLRKLDTKLMVDDAVTLGGELLLRKLSLGNKAHLIGINSKNVTIHGAYDIQTLDIMFDPKNKYQVIVESTHTDETLHEMKHPTPMRIVVGWPHGTYE